MRLENPRPRTPSAGHQQPWLDRLERHRLAVAAVCVGLLVVMLATGVVVQRIGLVRRAGHVLENIGAQYHPGFLVNYLRSFGADTERLTLDIKFKHYAKLAGWRQLALERGQITSELKDYVPATLHAGGKTHKVEIRLKGEWTDHLREDKWSFRIKAKGQSRVFGMKRFSIQHPDTRSYVHEWAYLGALRRETVAALRYGFVRVTVNGNDLGVYALEEGFAKELIERNERREGIILRFNGEYVYHPFAHEPGTAKTRARTGMRSFHSSDIVAYGARDLPPDSVLRNQLLVARSRLEAFRAGQLRAGEVFDLERLAAYFTVSELMGALASADDWSDMRFLYDPITSRLEPVGVEGAGQERIQDLLGARYTSGDELRSKSFHSLVFRDEEFLRVYVEALERVSTPAYVDELIAALRPGLDEQLRILHREWPREEFAEDVLRDNAAVIRAFLNPSKGLHAYLVRADDGSCELELGSTQALPVEVLGVSTGGVEFEPVEPVMLPGKSPTSSGSYRSVRFVTSDAISWADRMPERLTVQYRLVGTTEVRAAEVFGWARIDESLLAADLFREAPNPARFPFLFVDESAKTITIESGSWRLEENLILPAGYTIVAGPGVELDLANSAKILSHSPLRFSGSEDRPVRIGSADGTGQGLVVLDAGGESVLDRVVFRGLTAPRQGGWELTGAVTFYRSPVGIRRCEFRDIESEDVLNLVHSPFRIEESIFMDTSSDALDSDFSDGRLSRSAFHRIGGDAVDLSGSKIELENLRFSHVSDKAVSVGEAAVLRASDLEILGAHIGVASKDRSDVILSGVVIHDAAIGLAVYQKKAEFGPSSMSVYGVSMEGVGERYDVEPRSSLVVDGLEIPATAGEADDRNHG